MLKPARPLLAEICYHLHSAIVKIIHRYFNLLLPPDKIKQLQNNHIIFPSRGAGVRVSFHFYNMENDLDKLIRVIDR